MPSTLFMREGTVVPSRVVTRTFELNMGLSDTSCEIAWSDISFIKFTSTVNKETASPKLTINHYMCRNNGKIFGSWTGIELASLPTSQQS